MDSLSTRKYKDELPLNTITKIRNILKDFARSPFTYFKSLLDAPNNIFEADTSCIVNFAILPISPLYQDIKI